MDWQYDENEKLGTISPIAATYLNTEISGGFKDLMSGYIIVNNPSSSAYSSGFNSNQTSGETSEESQQAYFSFNDNCG